MINKGLEEDSLKRKVIVMLLWFCLLLLWSGDVAFAASDMALTTTKQPESKVKVEWNVVEGAVKYNVLLSVGNKKSFKTKATLKAQDSASEDTTTDSVEVMEPAATDDVVEQKISTVISKITQKKTYYVRVQALDANGVILRQDTTNFYNGNIVSTTNQMYSYKDMQKDIKQLEKKYADYINVEIIGTTVDNRNIYDVILGNPNADKCVVFQASIHAREYMTTQLVMEQMEYYLDNYDQKYKKKTYKEIFDKVCVHVVAMSNPDGVTISQEGINGIRKASLRKKIKKMYGASYTTVWKANARGVDLNNQFDYNFKYKTQKKYRKGAYAGYGGKKPVSEKETKALVKLVNKVNPKAVVNYHAMGNVIYCNYGGPKKVQKKVYKLAGEIRSLTGYTYMGLDEAPGFANWLVCKKGIPSCTVEIGRYTTPIPISQFKTVWKQNREVMVATARLYY